MRLCAVFGAALALGLLCSPAFSQMSPPPGTTGDLSAGNHMGRNSMTQDQFNQLQEYADRARRLTKDDKAKGKTLADLLAEDKANAEALTASMPLSCQVNDAILAAQGPDTIDGKSVDTKTFEAACANGMGYFLISVEPGKPYGFSCLAAEATRLADVAAGRRQGAVCQLPANANLKAMLGSVMSHAGVTCTVKDHRWTGQNLATNTEFNEIVCEGGTGYMLVTALPGSTAAVRAVSCHDSAMQGLPCKLSDNGMQLVTLQTFKDALAQHQIACDAGDKDIHVFGKENIKKRYVVQFRCTQNGTSLVAFIPLQGATAPFEAIDCQAAEKRGFKCN
jgi:hypothetical protein